MKVRVQFTAQLRAAVGRSDAEIELPDGSSVAALLEHLAVQLDGAAPHLVASGGQVLSGLLVVVNNSATSAQNGSAIVLRAGDAVMLLPPIAGG